MKILLGAVRYCDMVQSTKFPEYFTFTRSDLKLHKDLPQVNRIAMVPTRLIWTGMDATSTGPRSDGGDLSGVLCVPVVWSQGGDTHIGRGGVDTEGLKLKGHLQLGEKPTENV